ncbi:MAG: hypothetical protein Q9222_000934 [Ikaeria aurantiellina]
MPTYGKKKRAIFPSFSVFQDDDNPPSLPHSRSAYTPLNAQGPASRSVLSQDHDGSSEIDELASTELLKPLGRRSNSVSTEYGSLRSSHAQNLQQPPAKPLPPLPLKPRSDSIDKDASAKQVLGPKSTNLTLPSKKNKSVTKSKISSPVLISSSIDPSPGAAATDQYFTTDQSRSQDNVARLVQQADIQQAQTKEKERILAAANRSFKPSPLQRGKSVLLTAKHAIATCLSSPKIKLGRAQIAFNRAIGGPEYGALSQQLETDKPTNTLLPVYESMRTRRETPEPQQEQNPFSDKMEVDEAWSDLDANFKRPNDKNGHDGGKLPASETSTSGPDYSADEKVLLRTKSPSTFSNKVSGLRQHPNPEFFSSSPIGFSTPRVRLEPMSDANGKKRLSTVLVRDPSTQNELDQSDDEANRCVNHGHDLLYGLLRKRKSIVDNPGSPTSKRAKTDSSHSEGNGVFTQDSNLLGASERPSSQDVEQGQAAVSLGDERIRDKGFGIVDLGIGKEAGASSYGFAESSSFRPSSRRHSSSLSRPTSVLFSRETRARMPLLENHNEDRMDVDELQLGESSKTIGRMMK